MLEILYQRILLHKKSSIIPYGSPRLNTEVIDVLDFTPLLISLINLAIHNLAATVLNYEIPNYHNAALYINLVIGIFNAAMPWSNIFEYFKLTSI